MQDRNGLKRGSLVTMVNPKFASEGKGIVLGFWSEEKDQLVMLSTAYVVPCCDGAALVQFANRQLLVNCDLLVRTDDEIDSIGDNGVTLADGTYLAYSWLAKILMEFDLSTISAIGSFRKQPAFVREHIAGTLKESGRLLLGAYPTPDWLVWGD